MDLVLLIARLLLAAVFLSAGVAKLADLAGSRRAIEGFGLPAAAARTLGLLLPLAEIALGAALLPAASAPYAALGALALLLAFCAGIGLALARGDEPDCHCFGQLHSAPAGPRTLLRNVALAAVAGLVAVAGWSDPGPSAVAWAGELSGAALAGAGLALVTLLFGFALFHLLRQNGRLLLRLDALEAQLAAQGNGKPAARRPRRLPSGSGGLEIGSAAPDFSLRSTAGGEETLGTLLSSGRPLLLVFTSQNCGPCKALKPDLARWQRELADRLTVAPVSWGPADVGVAEGLDWALVQEEREVSEDYDANGTPAAVLIAPDGRVASRVAGGADAIRQLVDFASEQEVPQAAPPGRPTLVQVPPKAKNGGPAPDVRLPDLDGRSVDLADLRGREVALLFWNPGCGFCGKMLDDLRAWERSERNGGPELVVVSRGSAEQNREQGIASPVLLDEGFETAQAFGASGTPMAVLVDAEGRVASGVAAGGQAVMDLLQGTRAEAAAAG